MYILVFQWVKGESAWALCNKGLLSENEMWDITLQVKNDLADVSFRVLDHKPKHIILRWRKGGFLSHGALQAYALVDFELLEFRPALV